MSTIDTAALTAAVDAFIAAAKTITNDKGTPVEVNYSRQEAAGLLAALVMLRFKGAIAVPTLTEEEPA